MERGTGMKDKVLKLLMEAEDFISGEEMCQTLGVSRTAIWKKIQKLKEEGYSIVSVTNKGYKLSLVEDQLHAYELQHLLKAYGLFDEIFVYDTIDSTNKQAKRIAMEGRVTSALLLSDEQTLGIGRRGRIWVSQPGTGIYMSLLLKPAIKPINAAMLTLVTGLAVCKAISQVTQLDCQIKWPNDLVINGKKISGILTEMSSEVDFINYVVIGIGINVNNEAFDETIEAVASSLKLQGGMTYSRKEIVLKIIQEFECLYRTFILEESLAFILEDYNQRCVTVGKKVKIEIKGETVLAEALRVSQEGGLVVRNEAGQELMINSGEVSVRGLLGYV